MKAYVSKRYKPVVQILELILNSFTIKNISLTSAGWIRPYILYQCHLAEVRHADGLVIMD